MAELRLPKVDTDKKEEVKEEVKVEPRGEAADRTEYEFVEVSDVESEALSDRPEPGEKEEQVEVAEEDSSYYSYSYSSRPTSSGSYKIARQEQIQRSEPYWSNYRVELELASIWLGAQWVAPLERRPSQWKLARRVSPLILAQPSIAL